MKDNFSAHADHYAQYRPTYPKELFEIINTLVPSKFNAWDCGTGNGQVAHALSGIYQNVYTTDISQQQISHATKAPNIHYSIQPAEKTNFPNELFDIIIAAQAAHWFQFDSFYEEVKRTATPHGIICLVGYGNAKINLEIDAHIAHFYQNIIGPHWDNERSYIDDAYQTIAFPFTEIEAPLFENKLHWSFEHFIGYLNTWSGVKHFIAKNNYNPIDKLAEEIKQHWQPHQTLEITFPLFMRIAKVFDTTN